MQSILNAAKPLAFKAAAGYVDAMSPEQWEGLLYAVRTLIDTRLTGDAAGYRELYDRLELPPDVGQYITRLLWSHYEARQDIGTDADLRQDGQRENLSSPSTDPEY